jgi:acyl carrier protein
MDLLFALEERYDVSIPLNELDDVRTVGQLADVVAQRVRQS